MINTLIKDIQNTKWNITDDFKVHINHKNDKLEVTKILDNVRADTIWNKSVLTVDIPPISSPMMEHYLGGEWRIGVSKPEVFRFSMRFRDFDNGNLRRYFETVWTYSLYNYPEDSYLNLKITNRADNIELFSSEKILIENVSETQYDTQNPGVSEFTVSFRSPIYSDHFIKELGNRSYSRKFGTYNKIGN
jgi:hypothetical protein